MSQINFNTINTRKQISRETCGRASRMFKKKNPFLLLGIQWNYRSQKEIAAKWLTSSWWSKSWSVCFQPPSTGDPPCSFPFWPHAAEQGKLQVPILRWWAYKMKELQSVNCGLKENSVSKEHFVNSKTKFSRVKFLSFGSSSFPASSIRKDNGAPPHPSTPLVFWSVIL